MMISQFWNLCRACPALDVDKVSSFLVFRLITWMTSILLDAKIFKIRFDENNQFFFVIILSKTAFLKLF